MQQSSTIGISLQIQVFVVLAGLAILGFVLYLVRHKYLREQYSLLWILACLVVVMSAAFSEWVEDLSAALGIGYPPSLLFLIAILMMLVLQIHFSTVISKLQEQNKVLIQDLGILTTELSELRHQIDGRVSSSEKQSSKRPNPKSSTDRKLDHAPTKIRP